MLCSGRRNLWRTARTVLFLSLLVPAFAGARAEEEAAGDPPPPAGAFVRLPYGSDERAREFVEAGILRHLVPAGYLLATAESGDGPWKTIGLPSAAAWRFRKPCEEESTCTLELLLQRYPAGGFALHFYGWKVGADGAANNPELAKLATAFQGLLDELAGEPLGGPHDRFLVYPLSYVQADRAVAVLRSLGYAVIEYSAGAVKEGHELVTPDRIFAETREPGSLRRPVVVNLIDSEATSLVTGGLEGSSTGSEPSSSLKGGQPLAGITDAVPQQRLLIVWDEDDSESLDELLVHIQREIDVPARQILIEALVIEVNRDRLRELGIDLSGSKNGWSFSFSNAEGIVDPTVRYQRSLPDSPLEFIATLRALETDGEATVLSRPSVLVLDGRQARIKVAEEIPYTSEVSITQGLAVQSTGFLTAGIILNLRPRASFDNSEVSMQVETIISSAISTQAQGSSGVLIAPTVSSRQVQTLVRVSNDTPFVIGGLISLRDENQRSGVPWLSRIPGLGALFRRKAVTRDRQEVIVVITPHIIAEDDPTYSFTIARDADIFDTFGAELFRNVYRIRSSDVFDLGFITDDPNHRERVREVRELAGQLIGSDYAELPAVERSRLVAELGRRAAKQIGKLMGDETLGVGQAIASFLEGGALEKELDTFLTLFEGGAPGEEILVHRMMVEILEAQRFDDLVPAERVIFYKQGEGMGLEVERLASLEPCPGGQTRVLKFDLRPPALGDADADGETSYAFAPPVATPSCENVPPGGYLSRLRELYREQTPAILLNDSFRARLRRGDTEKQSPFQLLQSVLALERLLDLNDPNTFPRRLEAFHVGRELVFPTAQDLGNRSHLVDLQTARLFYETLNYYEAFQDIYEKKTRAVVVEIKPLLDLFREGAETEDVAGD